MKTRLCKFSLPFLICVALWLATQAPALAQTGGLPVPPGLPVVTIEATDPEAAELPPWVDSINPGIFTVRRTGDTTLPLTVLYRVGGTASNGVDYETLSGKLTVPAGASNATIVVWAIDDLLVEGTETVIVQLVPLVTPLADPSAIPAYVVGLPGSAVVRILDNEPQPAVVTIVATDPEAAEIPEVPPGQERPQLFNPAVFTVSRTGPTDLALDVFYHVGGTAENGVDYAKLPGTLTIPAGASSATIEVDVIDDLLVEGTETVIIAIEPPICPAIFPPPPGCYLVGIPARAEAIILDDDAPPTNLPPKIEITQPHNGDVFPALASIEIDALTLDPDGYAPHVDFYDGPNKIGESTILFFVAPPPGQPVTHTFQWLSVPPGPHLLTAVAIDDQGAKGISQPVKILVQETVPPVVVNIRATDPEGSEIPVVPPGMGRPQLYDPAVFTVTRSGPTNADLQVFYHLGGTALNGIDYDLLPGTLTIPAGASSADIFVSPIDDFLVEGTETVIATLEAPVCIAIFPPPPGCYHVGADNSATAYIKDNDVAPSNRPPVVNIIATDPFAREGTNHNTATFRVRRSDGTNDDLNVRYSVGGTASNGVDYVLLTGNVTIPAGRRSAAIVVDPIDDNLIEGIESVVIRLEEPVPLLNPLPTPPPYVVGFPARAAAIIVDNDRPHPPCVLLRDGLFNLCLPVNSNFCFRVEATTNLVEWVPVCENTVNEGMVHFVDPDAPQFRHRCYRVVPVPCPTE